MQRILGEFALLAEERRRLERQSQASWDTWNAQWGACLQTLRLALRAAHADGVRPATMTRWLDGFTTWSALQSLIRDSQTPGFAP